MSAQEPRHHVTGDATKRAKKRGGLGGMVSRIGGMTKATLAFVSLYTIPSIPNETPVSSRMEPAY